MKKSTLMYLFLAMQTPLFAQEYFPEGTKWTEIRLDTLKYDNWYSKVGDEWVANFETIKYYVQGEYPDRDWIYKKVYTNGPEWADSLTFLIREENDNILVTVLTHGYEYYVLWPGEAYQFDWSKGKGLYFKDILMSNTASVIQSYHYYGIIDEIKEGTFGGIRTLRYVDLDGKAPVNVLNRHIYNVDTKGGRVIQGIGITEWNDGVCLFGPPNPYSALKTFDNYQGEKYHQCHYRSMLVHFERNGEVLYDFWPEKEATNKIKSISKAIIANTLFDLQGRKLQQTPQKGICIQNRKKKLIK